MAFTNQKLTRGLLFSLEGVGAVFVIIYLAAYLGGMPTTNVLQNQPAVRIPLQIFGTAFIVLILATIILAVAQRKPRQSEQL